MQLKPTKARSLVEDNKKTMTQEQGIIQNIQKNVGLSQICLSDPEKSVQNPKIMNIKRQLLTLFMKQIWKNSIQINSGKK